MRRWPPRFAAQGGDQSRGPAVADSLVLLNLRPCSAPSSTAEYDEAIDFLLGRIDYERMLSIRYDERDLKLERMHELVERLGNPRAGDADRPRRRDQGQGLDRRP